MASDNMKRRRLQELDESDFEIADGQPDIRGWDVKNESGETIGEVDELILDAHERRIRYMIVDLDNDLVKRDSDDKVLIPIGLAELHENDDDVIVQGITMEQIRQLPAYDEDRLDVATEDRISSVLGRTSTTGSSTNFYEHEHFNDKKLYGRRLLEQHTSAETNEEHRGIHLNQRSSMTDSDSDSELGINDGRPYLRNYENESVEEDSLLSVSRDRQDTESDNLSDDIENRSQSPVERDIERRNRNNGSTDRNVDY